MELRDRISAIIEQVGEGGQYHDLPSEQIAEMILAIPEIREGLALRGQQLRALGVGSGSRWS